MRASPEPAKLAELLHRVARRLEDDGTAVLRTTRDWQIPLSSPSGPGPKNTVSDPVGNVAARRAMPGKPVEEDSLARLYGKACTHMDQLEEHAANLEFILELVMRDIPVEQRERMQKAAGVGYCECCGRWVAGTSVDRLRSQFCDACYKAWSRAGRPDRGKFIRRRRRELERKRTQ